MTEDLPDPAAPGPAAPDPATTDPAVTVLLVEDDPDDVVLVEAALASYPSIALRHCDRMEALESGAAGRPDVVLLDLHLPGSRGLATVDRAMAALPGVPVVAFTTLDDDALAIEALRRGAEDYLVKAEADGPAIVRVLTRALARVRSARDTQEHVVDRLLPLAARHPDGVVSLDAAGRVVSLNVTAEVLIGHGEAQVHGWPLDELISAGDRETVVAWWRDVQLGVARSGEVTLASGVPVEATAVPIGWGPTGEDGAGAAQIDGAYVVLHDLTVRRRQLTERALLAASLDKLAEGLLLLHGDTLMHRYANSKAADLLGVDVTALVGRVAAQVLPPALADIAREVVGGNTDYLRDVVEIVGDDGDVRRTLDVIAQRLELGDDEKPSVAVLLRDRGALDRAERERQQLLALMRSRDLVIVTLDAAGRVVTWNPGAHVVLGVAPQEAIGADYETLLPLADEAGHTAPPVGTRVVHRMTPGGVRILAETRTAIRIGLEGRTGVSIIARDLTDLEDHRSRLEALLAQFSELARHSDVITFRYVPDTEKVTTISPTVGHILGLSADDIVADARVLLDRIDPEQATELLDSTQAIRSNVLVRVTDADGMLRHLEMSSVPVFEGDAFVAVDGFARDVTERVEAQQQLERNARQLEAANAQLERLAAHREDLLSVVSHELRTPLTPITGFAELLLARHADALGDEGRRLLEVIQRNAARLTGLVDELLVASRATSGRLGAIPTATSVAAVVGRMIEDLGHPPDEVTFRSDTDARAWVDARHLEQILGNLVTNARRYGRPPVEVAVIARGEDVVVRVADHGEGVPAEFAARMFDAFAQASSGERRTGSGVGLGLWIVRVLTELNGGTVAFVPTPAGTGAVFEVVFPAAVPGSPPLGVRTAAGPRSRTVRDRLRAGLTGADPTVLAEALTAALDSEMSARDLVDEVFVPILVEVGEQWLEGYDDVATVNQVSSRCQEALAWLAVDGRASHVGFTRARVIHAVPNEEEHTLPARLASFVLAASGVEVAWLGRLRSQHLAEVLLRDRPDALLLTVTGSEHLLDAARLAAIAGAAGVPTIAGGRVVPVDRAARIGAIGVADLDAVVETLDTWRGQRRPSPLVTTIGEPARQVRDRGQVVTRWIDEAVTGNAAELLREELRRFFRMAMVARVLDDDELLTAEVDGLARRLEPRGGDAALAAAFVRQIEAQVAAAMPSSTP